MGMGLEPNNYAGVIVPRGASPERERYGALIANDREIDEIVEEQWGDSDPEDGA